MRPAILLACFALFTSNSAKGAVFTLGAVVGSADRTATFDSIVTGTDLSAYTEGQLSITVPDTAFSGFNAFNEGAASQFHYGSGGNNSFVTIKGTDDALFTALDFKLGDGFTGNTVTNLIWEARRDNVVVGFGRQLTISKGSIVGFTDALGFDELRVAANPDFSTTSVLGEFQAIALDNVRVQLQGSASVPEPATLTMFGVGALGLVGAALRRRKRAAHSC